MVGSWATACVNCVMVNTKTRSKNSSIVVTPGSLSVTVLPYDCDSGRAAGVGIGMIS